MDVTGIKWKENIWRLDKVHGCSRTIVARNIGVIIDIDRFGIECIREKKEKRWLSFVTVLTVLAVTSHHVLLTSVQVDQTAAQLECDNAEPCQKSGSFKSWTASPAPRDTLFV